MAPKRQKQKMSLNEFLGDTALGSWADEMESLPSAPATRTDEERAHDRYGRRDDFLSSRPDRGSGLIREDVPLPTQPPYTAFIGNLAFDLTEVELEDFFGSKKTKTIKIIKDRDDKPKGFGYIEFADLDGLKEALSKSGTSFSGRTIRVSVAEPPKERGGFGGGFDDDAKFEIPWRRDGPLPDSRDSSRRRLDGPGERTPGVSEGASDWRSSRPPGSRLVPVDTEIPSSKRRGSAFPSSEGAADKEDVWTIGSKFKPASDGPSDDSTVPKIGSVHGRGDMGPPRDVSAAIDESDWRSSSRPRPVHSNTSPSNSTPPTPQLGRRKLELLPRSGGASASPSPLSSPRLPPSSIGPSSRSNPFGAAKPIDVSSKEQEVAARLAKEREASKDRLVHSLSRTSSRTGSERNHGILSKSPPHSKTSSPPTPGSPKLSNAVFSNVRPSLSFANAAGSKKDTHVDKNGQSEETAEDQVVESTEKVSELLG